MKKILGISGIRSDYDLLSSLYKKLANDKDINFKLLVGGAQLSSSYGMGVEQIQKDGIGILLKIESLIDSDSDRSRLKSASIFLQNSIDIVAQFAPDLIIYSGDREEVMIGALLGGYLEIPTIHFYAGDHAHDGHVDNPIRHAASKLSTAMFVTLPEHKERLIKMGEPEYRIKIIGSIALDRLNNDNIYSKEEIKSFFKIKSGFNKFALVIYHPLAEEKASSHLYFENILKTLEKSGINAFVSYPNTDPSNKKIIEVIKKYAHHDNFYFYKNLERRIFLGILKNCILMVGNSSSGILESASIPVPAVNVGLRQKGRIINDNVIFCNTDSKSIDHAIKKALSLEFMSSISKIENVYGDGKSTLRAYELIKKMDLKGMLYKKEDVL